MALIINKRLFDKKRNLYIAAFIRCVGSANEIEQRRGGTMDGLLSDSAAAQERWEVGREALSFSGSKYSDTECSLKRLHTRS